MSHLISKAHAELHSHPSTFWWVLMAQTHQGVPAAPQKPTQHLWTSFSPKPTATGTAQANFSCPGAPALPDPIPQHCSDHSMWVMGLETADISVCSALPVSGKAKEQLGAARKVPHSQMPWTVRALLLDGTPQVSKPWFGCSCSHCLHQPPLHCLPGEGSSSRARMHCWLHVSLANGQEEGRSGLRAHLQAAPSSWPRGLCLLEHNPKVPSHLIPFSGTFVATLITFIVLGDHEETDGNQ